MRVVCVYGVRVVRVLLIYCFDIVKGSNLKNRPFALSNS
jgi:hypothetical protein